MTLRYPERREKSKKFFPHFVQDFDSDKHPPYFSFRYLTDSHCITKCNRDEQASFAKKMLRLSKLTWGDIKQQDRHKLGFEKIARTALRTALPSNITEDVSLIAFRFHEFKPMIGYRVNATFYVVWFDPKMRLYDHG
jgi:hypothetical protein